MKTIFITCFILILCCTLIQESQAQAQNIFSKESIYDFETTYQKALHVINEKKLHLFYVVDHSEAAKQVGKTMENTKVIIFGNPNIGTDIMNLYPTIAIELPLKLLIYEKNGKTFVVFISPESYLPQHGIPTEHAFIKSTQNLLLNITTTITQ